MKWVVIVTGPTLAGSTVEKQNLWKHEEVVEAPDMEAAKWLVTTRPPISSRAIRDVYGWPVRENSDEA